MHFEIQDSSRVRHDLALTGFPLKLLFPKFQPQGPNVSSSSPPGPSDITAFSLPAMCLSFGGVYLHLWVSTQMSLIQISIP